METPYRIIRSQRKTIAIQIKPDGEVIVRAPKRMTVRAVEQFVQAKQAWIRKHLPRDTEALPKLTEQELRELARQAKLQIPQRVAHYAQLLGVSFGRITIRSQHTRWGSCSGKGNLNFNCLLSLAPEEVLDYVVVHELCHRKHMNHSREFWAQVEAVLPDFHQRKLWLKENGSKLLARLP